MENLTIAYALIAAGVVVMAAELFVPTHGILLGLGIAAVIVGVALTFHYGSLPIGMTTLLVVLIVVPVLGGALLHIWPKTPMGKRLFLPGPDDDTVANMPVHLELEQLRGRCGQTVSALRPCGIVDFSGKRVDTMTDGEMIEPNQWVRCVDIKAGHVIVRQIAGPPDLGSMDTELFDKPPA
jgi:membrane-bound ClpP family serine protease